MAASASSIKFLMMELLPTGRAVQRPKQAQLGLWLTGRRITRNIATVKTAKMISDAIDGQGDAVPATSNAPKKISVGAIVTATSLGAPNWRAAASQAGSRIFRAPERRKPLPKISRAASATVLDQLNVP